MKSLVSIGMPVVFAVSLVPGALALNPEPVVGFEGIRDRLHALVYQVESGVPDSLGPRGEFDDMPIRSRIEIFASTESLRQLVLLGDRSPLKARVTPQRWRALNRNLPLLENLSSTMASGLLQAAREGVDAGSLSLVKTLLGQAGSALESALEGDLLRRATGVLTADGFVGLAGDEALTTGLMDLASRDDIDAELKDNALHLYVLLHATRARVEVHVARLDRAL